MKTEKTLIGDFKMKRGYNTANIFDELHHELLGGLSKMRQQDKSMVETGQWIPSIDIIEDVDKFIVLADVPGVATDAIDISMEDNVLTVKGHKVNTFDEKRAQFTRTERSSGSFYRQFTLPDTIASDKISAKSKHGVLEIWIPKQEKAKPRTISIGVED